MDVESYMKAVFPRSSEIEQSLANMSIADRNDDNNSVDHDDLLASAAYLTPRYSSPSPPTQGHRLGQKESFELVNALTRSIQAQGPIPIEVKQSSKPRGKITDISCIRCKQSNAADAPIVVIAYASGIVDICILRCPDEVLTSARN
jgi:hypothetical protein